MGAVNFSGGSWCGGGYGKLFDKEFEYENCLSCGEKEGDCDCEEPYFYDDGYDQDYCGILFNKFESELDKIENKVIDFIRKSKKKTVKLTLCYKNNPEKFYQKYVSIEKILNGLQHFGKGFLTIERGYYRGFQIYTNVNILQDYYGDWRDDNCVLNESEAKEIMFIVNNTLNLIEWDYDL